MTHHHRAKGKGQAAPSTPDIEETKTHILAAGRELLLAAHGALAFCREYVESQAPKDARPNLVGFFQKAISVADDLGKGISKASSFKRAAEEVAKPLFTAMAREMKEEAQGAKHEARGTKHEARTTKHAKSRRRK